VASSNAHTQEPSETTADPAADPPADSDASARTLKVGTIAWADLTIPDADQVRDFYRAVVGWTAEPVEMGGYSDYSMERADGQVVAGICHARGVNAGLPAQWLVYIIVADVDASAARCVELGGTIIAGPRGSAEQGRYCVIQDPAGAVAALYAPAR
jgi:predicted enzyme related to lactoylglutathione lyase